MQTPTRTNRTRSGKIHPTTREGQTSSALTRQTEPSFPLLIKSGHAGRWNQAPINSRLSNARNQSIPYAFAFEWEDRGSEKQN
ncbi:hypothetical protein CEXT_405281 [Caerostris extrusa]|uniref:Uncharacterized protein n=1 Tax=Caerostris extrusa TaxID=172846 RepID=A0AAV4VJP6_CAEEX|nr:hypothetical protein CEXT_405281 [Caerostris extrusa]